jgi:hypothetical protein
MNDSNQRGAQGTPHIMNNNSRDNTYTYPSTLIRGRSSVEGLGLGVWVRAGAGDGGHRLLQGPQFGRLHT